jgi:hypothetical protein
MANEALDGFLAAGAPEAAPEPPPESAAPEPAPEPQQKPDAKPAPEAKAPAAKEPEEDEEFEPARDGEMLVPRRALEKVRNDWKSKAAAERAVAEELRRQLEEVKRAPQTPAPQPAPAPMMHQRPMPDPATDPHGWARHVQLQHQEDMLNERLNNSEERLRDKIGDEKLDEYVAEFKQLAERDQSLFPKLYNQRHPYGWMQREVERQRVLRDVGEDPTAYRTKIEAEARAKWEAEAQQPEQGNGGARISPAAGLAPSLANARSVAGRTTTTFTGPPALEELFPGHNRQPQRR